jgi:NitT/TauT family transport system permease protein
VTEGAQAINGDVSRHARSRRRLSSSPRLVSLLVFVLVILGWECAVHALGVPRIILPAPSAIAISLWNSLLTPSFYYHIGVTLYEAMAGFLLGGGSGFLLGVLIGQSRFAEQTLYPYIVAFQTLPKVAVAPIVLIWFGYGLSSKIVITATISFFPLLANTIAGMRATPVEEQELFRVFMASRWHMFLRLQMPRALPFVFVGIDLSILLSVTGALVGEFVGARAGLGFLILQRNLDLNMAGTFAILTVLGAIGLALHLIVHSLQRRFVFWTTPPHEDYVGF